jgi:hypothetical protein
MREIAIMVSYLQVWEILVILLTPVAILIGSYLLFKVGALGPDPDPADLV